MLFNTFDFLWLFPIIFVVYYTLVMCRNGRFAQFGNTFLLLVSYGLYIKWKPIYAFILLWVTIVTYWGAKLIDRKKLNKTDGAKSVFVSSILFAVIPLFFFKYYNFVNSMISDALTIMGGATGLPGLNWVMPLGLSFFTLQAIGYLADVYLRRIEAENNWWHYMLFVSFFPQIASGPISKAKDLLPQIKKNRHFDYAQAVDGLRWFLWGMFLKVVMADRIGIYVDSILNNYEFESGLSCFIGSILYTFQIYGDFAGYSFMAVGVGKLLGFNLINNFNRPYLSQSVTEFWHRWHISLSIWLRDYIYIPLGGSRCSKLRNYWNIFVTFLVSGIWHGANWTFMVWGMIHGLLQIVEKMLGLHNIACQGWLKIIRIIITFLMVNFAWIFFRMPSLSDAIAVCEKIFCDKSLSWSASSPYMLVLIMMSLGIVLIKDLMDEFIPVKYQLFTHKYMLVRWSTYIVLMVMILACGVFDASQFIYVMF